MRWNSALFQSMFTFAIRCNRQFHWLNTKRFNKTGPLFLELNSHDAKNVFSCDSPLNKRAKTWIFFSLSFDWAYITIDVTWPLQITEVSQRFGLLSNCGWMVSPGTRILAVFPSPSSSASQQRHGKITGSSSAQCTSISSTNIPRPRPWLSFPR